MSAQEHVARLEALLLRVQSRREAPRTPAAAGVAPAAPAPAESTPTLAAHDRGADHTAITVPPAPSTPVPTSAVVETPHLSEALEASLSTTVDVEVDVEVAEGTAEVDLEGIEEDELAADSLAGSEAAPDVAVATPAAERDVPASSRRPIQLDPLPELAFDDMVESKAIHTPPPESGRQVAPPEDDFERSGVRPLAETAEISVPVFDPPPAPEPAPRVVPPTPEPPARVVPPVVPPPAARAEPRLPEPRLPTPDFESPPQLVADVTRPTSIPGSPAAVFHGAAPEFKPQTFGELLDATLAL